MEVKSVIKVILILFFGFSSISIKAQSNNKIFIEANISDKINLTENYCDKKITKNQIVFSIGLETLGEINQFIYNKKNDSVLSITFEEYKSLKFSSIKELNKILQKKKKFNDPNSVFRKIFIVEKHGNEIQVYRVCWQKKIYTE